MLFIGSGSVLAVEGCNYITRKNVVVSALWVMTVELDGTDFFPYRNCL